MKFCLLAFFVCALLLSGCGGSGGSDPVFPPATFRSASPLTFSVSQQPHEMGVRFAHVKAQTRGQLQIILRETPESAGYAGDDVAADQPLDPIAPYKQVRFYDLTPGTYRLEARDADGTRITTDDQGNLLIVRVTE